MKPNSNPDLFSEGAALRDAALTRLERSNAEILSACRAAMREIAKNGPVDADDARDWLARQEDGARWMDRRKDWMGALFKTAEWMPVGWKISRAPQNHARPIRVWRLKTFEG